MQKLQSPARIAVRRGFVDQWRRRLRRATQTESDLEMAIPFMTNSTSGPWIKLDGQAGVLKISTPDGDDKIIEASGLVVGVDLNNATQGWLALSKGMRDWRPITDADGWGERPSEEHKQGIEVDIICRDEAFGDEPVRVLSGNSKAVVNWFAALMSEVGDVEGEAIPTIKINKLEKKALGKGSTVAVDYKLAPKDKWIKRDESVTEIDDATTSEAASSDDNW